MDFGRLVGRWMFSQVCDNWPRWRAERSHGLARRSIKTSCDGTSAFNGVFVVPRSFFVQRSRRPYTVESNRASRLAKESSTFSAFQSKVTVRDAFVRLSTHIAQASPASGLNQTSTPSFAEYLNPWTPSLS